LCVEFVGLGFGCLVTSRPNVTQWDIIEIEGLRLVLVMTLARDDFMAEIDSSYKQLGIVMSFAGPIIIVLTFACTQRARACVCV
jgi:hypothetical protein